MTRFTFADVLPTAGSTAPLLLAAIASPHPLEVGKLASAAAISKFAASRAAAPLLKEGLLLRDADYGDELSFNRDHPLAPTLVQLAWRYSGIQPPPTRQLFEMDHIDWADRPQLEDWEDREVLPQPLWLESPADARLNKMTGPTLLQVRDTITALYQLTSDLRGFERDSQAVFGEWKNERHRDYIHQVLHLGPSTSTAAGSLRRVADADAQGEDDPRVVTVSGRTWLRAVYLVSAEASRVSGIIRMLSTAIDRGLTLHRLRADALYELRTVNHTSLGSDRAEKHLNQALQDEAEANELWTGDATAERGRYMFVGGTPNPVDVGTAGDQLLAVRLAAALETLTSRVAEMATEPGVSAWFTLFADDCQRPLPLMTAVPEDIFEPSNRR